jgi:hypothetical protein
MKTRNLFLISIIVFVILLFIIPCSFISRESGNTLLTVLAFLFGIIAGFYIVVATTDYNNMKGILAEETAGWIALYQNVLIYDNRIAAQLSTLLDAYIIRAFDFEIIDYAKSTGIEFKSIQRLIGKLPIKNQGNLSGVYEKILDVMNGVIMARQRLTVLGTKTLAIFQWIVLISLAILFVITFYGLRTGDLFFDVATVAIASSVVLVLLLIRDLDLYIWNERTFGYDIFENILRSIGKLPYYPFESISKKRLIPNEKEYRVGILIDYPKSLKRKIEIRKT